MEFQVQRENIVIHDWVIPGQLKKNNVNNVSPLPGKTQLSRADSDILDADTVEEQLMIDAQLYDEVRFWFCFIPYNQPPGLTLLLSTDIIYINILHLDIGIIACMEAALEHKSLYGLFCNWITELSRS